MNGPKGGQELRRPDDLTAFFSKVAITDGCWTWQGAVDSVNGYGVFRWRGKPRKAHRVAYAIAHGYTPAGLVVMHTCDNPPCVNPDHLVLGTQLGNVHDAITKGRFRTRNSGKTKCIRGHEFTAENTHITPQGRRNCRTCNRERCAAWRKGLYQEWKNSYA
jgi:hypothetical protein